MKATNWAITVIVLTSVLGVILTIIFLPDAFKTDPYARYALAIHTLVALMLGVYFFYLQKKDSDKLQGVVDHVDKVVEDQSKLVARIDEVVKMTASMAAEERVRAARRKQYCLGVMKGCIKDIREKHETLRAHCKRLSEYEVTDEVRKSYSDLTRMDHDWITKVGIPRYTNAVSQIADLLEDSYLSTYGIDEPESTFSELIDPDVIHAEPEFLASHMEEIDKRKQTFDFFISHIEREMPVP